MISKPIFEMVAREQRNEPLPENLIEREKARSVSAMESMALIVKGIRRCGKSTLLQGKMESGFKNAYLSFNFDDERLYAFETSDFQALMEIFSTTAIRIFGNPINGAVNALA